MRRATIGLLAFALIAVTLSGCSKPPAESADEIVQMVAGNKFNPADVTIKKGQTVEWINDDTNPHNVASTATDKVESGDQPMEPGVKFQMTFNAVEVWEYYCTIHGGMTGKVTVTA